MARATIIQAHLGGEVPAYLYDQIRQTRLLNPEVPLYLILEEGIGLEPGFAREAGVTVARKGAIRPCRNHRLFLRRNRLGRKGLGGFWRFAAERFFAIESLLEALELENVVHLENDVMLYAGLSDLMPAFERSCPALGVTMDCRTRCIPGVVYIKDRGALSALNEFIIENSLRRGHTDMEALAAYMAADAGCSALPVVPPAYRDLNPLESARGERAAEPWYFEHFEAFGGVFDAAALGQFLGGIDTRGEEVETRGFVNETAVYDPRRMDLHWKVDGGLRRPYGRVGKLEFPIFNLHIHSKRLAEFSSQEKACR